MAFRKYARVQSVGFATNDGTGEGFKRLARAASDEPDTSSSQSISPSYYIDGVKKIDVRATLEKVADKYAISADPSDYIFEAIRANTTNIPNENHDGFHKSELLRFDLQAGMPVYETYKEKGHFVNHLASAPKRARGVIVDAHYYADTPPLDQCPSCDFDTKQASSRDATGIHCKRCAFPVKDEFVEILVAVDTKKDPAFANAVKSGALNAGSMGCFVPGTLISLADGTRCPIENIKIGDRVITHTGKVAEVAETMVHPCDDDVYQVNVQGLSSPIVATLIHPFWVVNPESGEGKWVEASDLKPGQYLRCPRTKYETVEVENDFARLAGYFVSEGNFIKAYDGPHKGTRVGLEFSFSITETKYVEEVASLLKKYGNNPQIYERPSRSLLVVKDYRCIDLATRMFDLVGQHAISKTLSSEIMAWPREAQLNFIGTWLNGDGYSIHDAGHSWSAITTSSDDLRDQLSQLLVNLGIPHRLSTQVSGFGGKLAAIISVNGDPQLDLIGYSDKIKRQGQSKRTQKVATLTDKDGLLRKIKSITTEPYLGPVYNFEVVDEDHSYVAGGVAVHNCNCSSTTCNVCAHVAHSVSDFCDHIRRGNKGTYWIKDAQGPNKGSWRKADKRTVNAELNKHGRRFIPEDFCSVVANDGFEVRKAFEYCNQVEFDEYSRVDQPADPKALQREILKAASLDSDQSDMALETEALLLQAKLNSITARLSKSAQLEIDALAVMQPDGEVIEIPEGSQIIDEHDPENENSVQNMVPENHDQAPGHAPMAPGAPGIDGLSDQMSPGEDMLQDQWTPESLGILPKAGLDEDGDQSDGNHQSNQSLKPIASVQEQTPFMFNKDYGEFYAEVTAAGNATVISKAGALLTVSAGRELTNEDDRNAFGRTVLASVLSNGIVDTALKYDGSFPPRFAQILDAAIEDMQDYQMRPEVPSIHDKDDNMRDDAGRPVVKGLPDPIEDDGAGDMDMTRESSDSLVGDRIENFENDGPASPESLSTVEDDDTDMREDERPEWSMSKSDASDRGVSNMKGNAGAVGKSASAEFEDNDEDKEEKGVEHEDKKEAAATHPRIPASTPNGISEQWGNLDKGGRDVSKERHLDVDHYPNPSATALQQGPQKMATLEARYKKLNAARIASIQKEANEKIAAIEATLADRFVRALKIVAQREALNLEESPMKAALFEMLASEQVVGHDRETGDDLVVGPISHDLAQHYVERSFQAGMAEEIDHLVSRAAELMKSDPAYIASAESDLRRQAAQIPTMTSKAQLGVEDNDTSAANEMQRQASKGNFYFSPAPEVEAGDNGFGRQSELGSALRSGSSKTNQFLDLIRSGPN